MQRCECQRPQKVPIGIVTAVSRYIAKTRRGKTPHIFSYVHNFLLQALQYREEHCTVKDVGMGLDTCSTMPLHCLPYPQFLWCLALPYPYASLHVWKCYTCVVFNMLCQNTVTIQHTNGAHHSWKQLSANKTIITNSLCYVSWERDKSSQKVPRQTNTCSYLTHCLTQTGSIIFCCRIAPHVK